MDYLEYAVSLRRELHMHPEIGFDLPNTLSVVRRELDAMGISYTEEYGRSSIVATINPEKNHFTIGIRGDMDALPIQEISDQPYCSKIPGVMHACGHDAHTAMVLATAKRLQERKDEINCCVKLLFTPAEEYINPGCKEMVEDGVADTFDCAIACHVTSGLDVGKIRVREGGGTANSMGFTVEFFGNNSHACAQQKGTDAIAMAVEAYMAMEIMVAKEFSPKEPRLLNIGSIHGGETNNIICDYCKMFGSARSWEDEVSDKLYARICQICEGVAAMHGGEAKVTVNKFLPYVLNNPVMTRQLQLSAEKVVGQENVLPHNRGLGGEDFSFFSRKKPCTFFWLGTRSDRPNTDVAVHKNRFDIDENAMKVGVDIFTQFVFDNMGGINFEE